jgi:hypothetical protein
MIFKGWLLRSWRRSRKCPPTPPELTQCGQGQSSGSVSDDHTPSAHHAHIQRSIWTYSSLSCCTETLIPDANAYSCCLVASCQLNGQLSSDDIPNDRMLQTWYFCTNLLVKSLQVDTNLPAVCLKSSLKLVEICG